jgi:hypothetical protein
MKHALSLLALTAVLLVGFTGCKTIAAEGTPARLQAVPTSQSLLLESAIESINENDPNWTNADGRVKRAAILGVLNADKMAWEQLDRFYNPETAPAAPTTE